MQHRVKQLALGSRHQRPRSRGFRILIVGLLGLFAAACGGPTAHSIQTQTSGLTFSDAQRQTQEAALHFANPGGPTTVPGATVQPCRTEVPTMVITAQGGSPVPNSNLPSIQPTFSASELATHEAAMRGSQPGAATTAAEGKAPSPTPTLPICPTPAMPQTVIRPAATPPAAPTP